MYANIIALGKVRQCDIRTKLINKSIKEMKRLTKQFRKYI